MIARLALRYLAVFAVILAALSFGAYEFVAREYISLLGPALGTPEAAAGYRAAMTRTGLTILAFDLPLLVLVGGASWLLARASIEPLLRAQERERDFVADAAHGLRSPLAVIASVAQAANKDPTDDRQAAFETITGAALDASEVVGDLLTLARDATPDLLHCEPVDIGALATSAAKEFSFLAAEHHVRLEVDGHSAIVNGDERRLRELLRNLLENALHHARTRITLSTVSRGPRVELKVIDDGDPVPPEMRERVFERFFRLSTDGQGTGLGLAIVRWIADAHGGDVFTRDAAAGGAEFVVRLPILR